MRHAWRTDPRIPEGGGTGRGVGPAARQDDQPAPAAHAMTRERGIEVVWLGRVGFEATLRLQEDLAAERARRDAAGRGDVLLLLEHEPVYTTGRGGRAENLPGGRSGLAPPPGVPVHRIGRGGDATYHGPGQLVGYAVVDLRARGSDVHRFLRCLEAGAIAVLQSYGVHAERSEGQTGVWVFGPRGGRTPQRPSGFELGGPGPKVGADAGGARKIASIGIGVRHGVSLHGFALNVAPDLGAFSAIVPCGIRGVEMTSIEAEGVRPVPSVAAVAECAARLVPAALAGLTGGAWRGSKEAR